MIKSLISLFSGRTSAARQEMFNQSEAPRTSAISQPKQPVQARVIDCGYVEAMRRGFCGTTAHWLQVKENYIKAQSKGNQDPNLVIDCHNILFDGQGMEDADGKWHR